MFRISNKTISPVVRAFRPVSQIPRPALHLETKRPLLTETTVLGTIGALALASGGFVVKKRIDLHHYKTIFEYYDAKVRIGAFEKLKLDNKKDEKTYQEIINELVRREFITAGLAGESVVLSHICKKASTEILIQTLKTKDDYLSPDFTFQLVKEIVSRGIPQEELILQLIQLGKWGEICLEKLLEEYSEAEGLSAVKQALQFLKAKAAEDYMKIIVSDASKASLNSIQREAAKKLADFYDTDAKNNCPWIADLLLSKAPHLREAGVIAALASSTPAYFIIAYQEVFSVEQIQEGFAKKQPLTLTMVNFLRSLDLPIAFPLSPREKELKEVAKQALLAIMRDNSEDPLLRLEAGRGGKLWSKLNLSEIFFEGVIKILFRHMSNEIERNVSILLKESFDPETEINFWTSLAQNNPLLKKRAGEELWRIGNKYPALENNVIASLLAIGKSDDIVALIKKSENPKSIEQLVQMIKNTKASAYDQVLASAVLKRLSEDETLNSTLRLIAEKAITT